MKGIRKRVWIAAAALTLAMSFGIGAAPAQAAVKNGLVQSKANGNYYFYKNGKKVTNAWKTVKVKKKKYKYYFGKNGAACKAKKTFDDSYTVKIFKIGKKKYGFDAGGHLVAGGTYADASSRICVFTSKGVYNEKKSKRLRKAFRIYDKTHEVSTDTYDRVIEAFGKPKKVRKVSSCNPLNDTDVFTNVTLIYKYYEIMLILNENTGEYAFFDFYARPL